MSEAGCPLCGKAVMGDTALIGHLEFGHDIAAPEAYLEQLRRPADTKRTLALGPLVRRAGIAVGALALAGAAFLGYQQLVVDGDSDVAAADAGPATTSALEAPTTTAPPTTDTTEPPATTEAPTTTSAPTTTAAPTTTTTTTEATPAAAPTADLEFRRPFLVDASHDGCSVRGSEAVHAISFRFSGSRNITFDGRFYPDETGDGPRETTHAVPAGATGYLDHVVVQDPAGTGHKVAISPPIHLGTC